MMGGKRTLCPQQEHASGYRDARLEMGAGEHCFVVSEVVTQRIAADAAVSSTAMVTEMQRLELEAPAVSSSGIACLQKRTKAASESAMPIDVVAAADSAAAARTTAASSHYLDDDDSVSYYCSFPPPLHHRHCHRLQDTHHPKKYCPDRSDEQPSPL